MIPLWTMGDQNSILVADFQEQPGLAVTLRMLGRAMTIPKSAAQREDRAELRHEHEDEGCRVEE